MYGTPVASERSTEAIGRLMSRLTGKARVFPEYVAQHEQGLRTQVDKAASDLVPGQAASVFTGLVVNRLLGSVEDDTLVRVGEALQGSLELAQAPAKPAEIEAPAQGGVVAHSTPAVGPGALTLTDLDELDAPAPRGALRRFDPAALDAEPRALPDLSGPGEADATIEPAEPAEPGREIKEPEPPDPGLGT